MNLSYNGTASDSKGAILHEDTFKYLLYVNVVNCIISVFGVVGNIVNLTVFAFQGFTDIINISLFNLAASDLITLLCLFWTSVCMLPWYDLIDFPFEPQMGWNIGSWHVATIGYNGCWLATFVTIERCICIVKPLKVKTIITRKVTVVFSFVVFFVCLAGLTPLYIQISFENGDKDEVEIVSNGTDSSSSSDAILDISLKIAYSFHAVMQIGSFFALTTATAVLVISLRRKTKWRRYVTSIKPSEGSNHKSDDKQNQDILSRRDRRIMKMVITISTIIIVCISPGFLLFFVAMFKPEFEVGHRLERLHIVCYSLACLCLGINASANMIIYYNMSSKYKSTLRSWSSRSRDSESS